jgi:hypothetical protein
LEPQAHPIWTTPSSRRQLDVAALLELKQQGTRRHILEQACSIAPFPPQSQLSRQTPPAPVRMLVEQQPDFIQPSCVEYPTLDGEGFRKRIEIDQSAVRSPALNCIATLLIVSNHKPTPSKLDVRPAL